MVSSHPPQMVEPIRCSLNSAGGCMEGPAVPTPLGSMHMLVSLKEASCVLVISSTTSSLYSLHCRVSPRDGPTSLPP